MSARRDESPNRWCDAYEARHVAEMVLAAIAQAARVGEQPNR